MRTWPAFGEGTGWLWICKTELGPGVAQTMARILLAMGAIMAADMDQAESRGLSPDVPQVLDWSIWSC